MASQKFGFVTVDPVSGSGDQAVNFSGDKHTGRLQRTINLTVTTNGGAKKALVVNQAAAAEVVRSDSPNASVQKTGGNVTITGKSNSTKLTFAVTPAEENGLTLQLPANYTAAGKITANGAVIADDPGAAGEFVWSITISDVPANASDSTSPTRFTTGDISYWVRRFCFSNPNFFMFLAASKSLSFTAPQEGQVQIRSDNLRSRYMYPHSHILELGSNLPIRIKFTPFQSDL